MVDVCLRRELTEMEDDNITCDCNITGFAQSVFDAVFNTTCISEEKCSSPILRGEECFCYGETEKTGKTAKTSRKSKEKSGCKDKKKSKDKSKAKSKAKSKEKTAGKCQTDATDSAAIVCVKGTLVCGSCDAAGAQRRKRDNIRGHLRFSRKTSTKYCGTNKKTKSGLHHNCANCMVSVENNNYDVTKIKVDKTRNFFCGDTPVRRNDRCGKNVLIANIMKL